MGISEIKPIYLNYNRVTGYDLNAFIHNDKINNKIVYKFIGINLGHSLSYDNIISTLINSKYTNDQITSITLNYLLTLHQEVIEPEKVKEYQQEYKELQEYRAACKAEAKKAIEYAEINDIHP